MGEDGLFSDEIWKAPVSTWLEIKKEAGAGELTMRLVLTDCYQSNPEKTLSEWVRGLDENSRFRMIETIVFHLAAFGS